MSRYGDLIQGGSLTHTHSILYVHTLWKSSPAVWFPFQSSPSEPLGETSEPQSHLPPLSPRLIHHITSSPSKKKMFPWQPGVTYSLTREWGGPQCTSYQQFRGEKGRSKAAWSCQPASRPLCADSSSDATCWTPLVSPRKACWNHAKQSGAAGFHIQKRLPASVAALY